MVRRPAAAARSEFAFDLAPSAAAPRLRFDGSARRPSARRRLAPRRDAGRRGGDLRAVGGRTSAPSASTRARSSSSRRTRRRARRRRAIGPRRPRRSDGHIRVVSRRTGADSCNAAAMDASGAAYFAGQTVSTQFPTTSGAFRTTYTPTTRGWATSGDAFVTKVNAAGSALVYRRISAHVQRRRRTRCSSFDGERLRLAERRIPPTIDDVRRRAATPPGSGDRVPHRMTPRARPGVLDVHAPHRSARHGVRSSAASTWPRRSAAPLRGGRHVAGVSTAPHSADSEPQITSTRSRRTRRATSTDGQRAYTQFPATTGAYQSRSAHNDAFVVKVSPTDRRSTPRSLGGGATERGFAMTVNLAGQRTWPDSVSSTSRSVGRRGGQLRRVGYNAFVTRFDAAARRCGTRRISTRGVANSVRVQGYSSVRRRRVRVGVHVPPVERVPSFVRRGTDGFVMSSAAQRARVVELRRRNRKRVRRRARHGARRQHRSRGATASTTSRP